MHLSLATTVTRCCDISIEKEWCNLGGDLRWTKEHTLTTNESRGCINQHVEGRPLHVEGHQGIGCDQYWSRGVKPFVRFVVHCTHEEHLQVSEFVKIGVEKFAATVAVRLDHDEKHQP